MPSVDRGRSAPRGDEIYHPLEATGSNLGSRHQEARSDPDVQTARGEQLSTSRRTSRELRTQLPSCPAQPDSHRPLHRIRW